MNNQKHVPEQGSDESTPANSGEEQEVTTKARRTKSGQTAAAGKPGKANAPARSTPAKSGGKSKKDQLIALLSKPNGTRVSVLVDRLGWQAHTVRAALSGLRKQGLGITTSKSAKTGEALYTIAARSGEEAASSDKVPS